METPIVTQLIDNEPSADRIEFWSKWASENEEEVGKMLALKEKQSEHDTMTGLLNRQGFFNRSNAKIAELMRNGEGFSFLFGDLNGLKVVNDRDGHKAGDQFLVTVAKVIQNAVRKEDICARIGGDEFAVLLPLLNKEQAAEIVTRISDSLPKEYSISFGVGEWDKVKDLETVIDEADSNMYSAKHAGLGFGARSSGIDLISLD